MEFDYIGAINEGYTDDEIVEYLSSEGSFDVQGAAKEGYSTGEIARFLSGVDEGDWQNQVNPHKERGFFGDLASNVGRGFTDLGELAGQALKTIDPDGGIDLVEKAGQKLVDVSQNARQSDFLRPDESEVKGEGFWGRGWKGGIRSAIPSLAPIAAGIATGAGYGALGGPGGAIVGGIIGGTGATLGLFGIGTYGQKKDEYISQGVDPETAHKAAVKQALIEGGIEEVSNLAGLLTLGFGKVAAQPIKQTAKELLKTSKRQIAKNFIKNTALNEIPTEMLQNALSAKIDQNLGLLPDGAWQEAALESIIPSTIMSLLFSGGVETASFAQKQMVKQGLNDEDVAKRYEAVKYISSRLDDPELSQAWEAITLPLIEQGQPIDINMDFTAMKGLSIADGPDMESKAEDPTTQSKIAKALAENDDAALDAELNRVIEGKTDVPTDQVDIPVDTPVGDNRISPSPGFPQDLYADVPVTEYPNNMRREVFADTADNFNELEAYQEKESFEKEWRERVKQRREPKRELTPQEKNDQRIAEIEADDAAVQRQKADWQNRSFNVPETDQSVWKEEEYWYDEENKIRAQQRVKQLETLISETQKKKKSPKNKKIIREAEAELSRITPKVDLIGKGADERQRAIQEKYKAISDIEQGRFVPADIVKKYGLVSDKETLNTPAEKTERANLSAMLSEVNNSKTKGVTQTADGEFIGYSSSSPRWMGELSKIAKSVGEEQFTRAYLNKIGKKVLNGEKLTKRQAERYELVKQAMEIFEADDPGSQFSDEMQFLEKQGYDVKGGQNIPAAELDKGDKFVGRVDGVKDEWEVKGEEDGEIIIQDGVTKRVDMFDEVSVDGIKKVESGQLKDYNSNNDSVNEGLFNEKQPQGKQLELFPVSEFQKPGSGQKKPGSKENQKTNTGIKGLVPKVTTGVETTGNISHSGLTVKSKSDAASFLSVLTKSPQEKLYTVAVDKNGKVIEVHAYSKGSNASSVARPAEIAGRVLQHKNASKVYFVHNHPSGETTPSDADIMSLMKVGNILKLKGIKTDGVIVGPDGSKNTWTGFNTTEPSQGGVVKETQKTKKIPVKERVFDQNKPGDEARNAYQAESILSNKKSGILLLNTKGKEVGYLDYEPGLPARKFAARVFKAVEKTNAAGAITYNDNPSIKGRDDYFKTLIKALRTSGVFVFDAVTKKDNGYSHFTDFPEYGKMKKGAIIEMQDNDSSFKELDSDDIKLQRQSDLLKSPAQAVTLKDIEARFKGQKVFFNPDDTISIRFKNGKGIRIISVKEIKGKIRQINVESGRMTGKGRILGATVNDTILLDKKLASANTMDHEIYHFLVNAAMITNADRMALRGQYLKWKRQNKLNFKPSKLKKKAIANEENEANTFAQLLQDRKNIRSKPLKNLIQRVMDLLDGLIHIGRMSARKLAREVESGKMFERGGREAVGGEVKNKELLNTETEAFKDWFGDSVVTVDGKPGSEPLVVYHGTKNDFNYFDINKSDLGAHFGTKLAANDALYPTLKGGYSDGSRVKPVYLSLQNPYDMGSDLGKWSDMEMLEEYLSEGNEGPFTDREFSEFKDAIDVREGLKGKGYDGIVYENEFEGKGSTSYIAFNPTQIKSIYNKGTWDKNNPDIRYEEAAAAWYSQMRDTLENKLNNAPAKMMKQQIQAWAKKGMFKQEELEWSGLIGWLDGKEGKVTKQQVLDFLDQNQVVVEEVVKDDAVNYTKEAHKAWNNPKHPLWDLLAEAKEEDLDKKNYLDFFDNDDDMAFEEFLADVDIYLNSDVTKSELTDTKFSDYQLPGGENYKEILLTLPETYKGKYRVYNSFTGEDIKVVDTEREAKEATTKFPNAIYTKADPVDSYKSSHWDEPNVLAHIRMSEREVDGKRVLHIEEIQSDWHQEGRKKGYGDNKYKREDVSRLEKNAFEASDPERFWYFRVPDNVLQISKSKYKTESEALEYILTQKETTVRKAPDGPFKKSWSMLAMKKMVRYAAENGFDTIAWSTGEQQFERWGSEMFAWKKKKDNRGGAYWKFHGKEQQGGNAFQGMENDLVKEAYEIGNRVDTKEDVKMVIENIMRRQESEWSHENWKKHIDKLTASIWNRMQTEDEGSTLPRKEGMKGFYDKILPAEVNKFFGKGAWGKPKVGEIEIPGEFKEQKNRINLETGQTTGGRNKIQIGEPPGHKLHALPITPEMKSKALREGMPMFKRQEKTPTNTTPFRRWFGRSVAKRDGKPIVFYHGTNADFTIFDKNKAGKILHTSSGLGHFFSLKKGVAGHYGDNVMPVHLRMTKPYRMSLKEAQSFETIQDSKNRQAELKDDGYDSVIIETGDSPYVIVFDSEQAKSVYNMGTWNLSNPDIMLSTTEDFAQGQTDTEKTDSFTVEDNSSLIDDFKYNVVNLLAPIEKVYKAIKKTIPEYADFKLKEELRVSKAKADIEQAEKRYFKPIKQIIGMSKMTVADVDEFLYARHAPEANARLRLTNAKYYLEKLAKAQKGAKLKNKIKELDALFDLMEFPTKEAQESYKLLLEKETGTIEDRLIVAQSEMEKYAASLDDNPATHEKKKLSQLKKDISKLNAELKVKEDWETFSEKPSGMTDAEASDLNEKWADNKSMKRIAKLFDAMNSEGLQISHDAGRMSDEEYESVKGTFDYYCPLFREGNEKKRAFKGIGGGIKNLGTDVKTRGGSTKRAVHILANGFVNHEKMIINAKKAEVAKAFLEFVKLNPNKDFWEFEEAKTKAAYDNKGNIKRVPAMEIQDHEVKVKSNGKLHIISANPNNVHAMRILDIIKGSQHSSGPIVGALSRLNRILASVNTTWNPEFVISNLARDLQTAAVNLSDTEVSGMRKKIFKNLPKAMKGLHSHFRGDDSHEWAKIAKQYEKSGAKIGWIDYGRDIESKAKKLESQIDLFREGHVTKKTITKLLDFVEDYNSIVENAVRLSTFKAGVDAGMSEAKAAITAKGLTVNFNQRGEMGPVINSLYLFANAGIQGSVRIIKTLKNSKQARKIVGGSVLAAMGLAMANSTIGGDDDDGIPYYDKIDTHLKARNMIFMIPGSDGDFVKIPLPWGYNVFWALGTELGDAIVTKGYKPLDGVSRMVSTSLDAFNPLQSATVLQTISPTISDPFAQVGENKTFFGSPLMPERNIFDKTPVPDSERYWKSVRPISKELARIANSWTGGDKVKPGMADISPETLDLVFDTLAGGAGRFILDTVNAPFRAAKGDFKVSKIPGVRRVFGNKSEYKTSTDYRENIQHVYQLVEQSKVYPEKRKTLMKDKTFYLYGEVKKREKQIRALRKLLKKTKSEKAQDRIETKIERIKQTFNKKFITVRTS